MVLQQQWRHRQFPMGQDDLEGQTQIVTPQTVDIDTHSAASEVDYSPSPVNETPRYSNVETQNPRHHSSLFNAVGFGQNLRHSALQKAMIREQGQGLIFLLLPVALGIGAGLYFTVMREPSWQMVCIGFIAVSLLAIMLSHKRAPSNLIAVLALVAVVLVGLLAGRLEAGKATVLIDGRVTTTLVGRVLESRVDSANHTRYLLEVLATSKPAIRRAPTRVRLVARAEHTRHAIGTQIVGRAQLTPPSGPAYPGGYDFARNAYGQGIGAYGFFYAPPVSVNAGIETTEFWVRFTEGINHLRSAISERVRASVPGDPGALIAALTVSDRGGISDETVDMLRATGLAHILAISGLHMALAAGTFYITLRKLAAFSPRLIETIPAKKYAAVGAILIATSYLLISGAGIPTRRAWLMMVVMFGAVLFDRQALTMRNVALAALGIIAISPSAVVTPGFQMSFAATAALIAAYDAWSRRVKTVGQESGTPSAHSSLFAMFFRFAGGLAMTSLVAGLATGLFAAYHFHQFAAYGLVANLLAMPLVTFLVMPMGLLAMLAMPFGLDHWPLQAMGLALEGVMAVAKHVDAIEGDMVTGKLPFWPTIMAASGFVALVFLRTKLRLLALIPLFGGLCLSAPLFRSAPPDILVSEDGRLVGLFSNRSIATNANRPGDFVFGQWKSAYLKSDHLAPSSISKARKSGLSDPHDMLAALADLAQVEPEKFVCANRATCMAFSNGHMIAAIADPAFMGAGCDLSEIVILAAAIYTEYCRSGAHLITARRLKRTGTLAIRFPNNDAAAENSVSPRNPENNKLRRQEAPPKFEIKTALRGVIRPWTIQRYYDWRSDAFDLPDTASGRAALAVDDADRIAKSHAVKPGLGQNKDSDATTLILPKSTKLTTNLHETGSRSGLQSQ